MPGIANQTAAIETVEPYRFEAFISYSHRDAAFARRLHRALTGYHPPRELRVPQRRLRVFRDEWDFQGPEYGAALADGRLELATGLATDLLGVLDQPETRVALVTQALDLSEQRPAELAAWLDEAAAKGADVSELRARLTAPANTPK